jgi:hypothetical protein
MHTFGILASIGPLTGHVSLQHFIGGAIAMACFTAGLFFMRFWMDTHDRLFGIFGVAFFVLGLNRVALTFLQNVNEGQMIYYSIRLVAYVLILIAIIDKNRKNA